MLSAYRNDSAFLKAFGNSMWR